MKGIKDILLSALVHYIYLNMLLNHMVRPDLKDRSFMVYFPSANHLKIWSEDAKKNGISLSRYILEMAEKGRTEKKPSNTRQRANDAEVKKLEAELRTKTKLIDKYETELWKLRHSGYALDSLPSSGGSRRMNNDLINLLKQGSTWSGPDLLAKLGIDPTDTDAMKILLGQLQALAGFGLAKETADGWRWKK
jgi:hypothetical protein